MRIVFRVEETASAVREGRREEYIEERSSR
jgi:hypothetical protein